MNLSSNETQVENPKPLITSVTAAARFGVTNDYVTQLCRRKVIIGSFVGRMWHVDEQSLENYLKQVRADNAAKRAARTEQLRQEYKNRNKELRSKEHRVDETLRYQAVISPAPPAVPAKKNPTLTSLLAKHTLAMSAVLAFVVSGAVYATEGHLPLGPEFVKTRHYVQTTLRNAEVGQHTQVAALSFAPVQNFFCERFRLFCRDRQETIAIDTEPSTTQEESMIYHTAPTTTPAGSIYGTVSLPPTQPLVQNTYPVIERVVEAKSTSGLSVTTLVAILSELNKDIRSDLSSIIGNSVGSSVESLAADALTIADLTDANIPDTLTVSGYLPLAGGTLTGQLISTSNATSTFTNGIDLSDGCFAIDGTCLDTSGGGGGSLAFDYPFPSNATSTTLTFSGGLLSTASSTIGSGSANGGLTIAGNATTTGNLVVSGGKIGIGTPAVGFNAPLSFGASLGDNIYFYDAGVGSSYGIGIQNLKYRFFTDGSGADIQFGYGGRSTEGSFTPNVTFRGNGFSGFGTTTPYSKLTTWGTGQLFEAVTNASTTVFSIGQTGATTTGFAITNVASSLLKTDSSGNVLAAVAGTDYVAGSSFFAFPFTTGAYYGQTVNATSTALRLTGSPYALFASSTSVFTNASTTLLTLGSDFISSVSGDALELTAAGVLNVNDVTAAMLASSDFGDFSCGGVTCLLDDDTVSDAEIDYITVTLADFTNDAGFTTFAYPFPSNATSTALTFSGGLLSTASTTIGNGTAAGGLTISGTATTTLLHVFSNGINVGGTTFTSLIPTTRSLTIAGTASQITSSAGAQDLSADRTWTLSLPSHVIFPSSFQATSASTTNATSTTFAITGLTSSLLKTNSDGSLLAAVAGSDYVAGSSFFAYPFPSNATSTLLSFNGGLTSYASTTIGDGTASGGLTVSGGATTTGSVSLAGGKLLVTTSGFGTTTLSGLAITGSATSTSDVGWNITTGCFAISGECVGGGSSITGTTGQLAYFSGTDTQTATSTLTLSAAGNFGVGTTSPFAQLSVHRLSTDTNYTKPLFALASSTASATTTLFSVDNTGLTTIGDPTGTGDANVQFAADDNAWSLGYYSTDKSFRIASSTNLAANVALTIAKTTSAVQIGIGTTTPVSTLSIQGSLCVRSTGSCGTTAGTIYATTATISDIDLAENYTATDQTLAAGEIVALDTATTSSIRRARPGDVPLGIISTKPGLLLGQSIKDGKPVALKGRVPLKVNLEGGEIEVGDPLTLSSVPGVGMKATTTAWIVGIALEPYNASTAKNASSTIEVFVQSEFRFDGVNIEALASLTAFADSATSTSNADAEQGFVGKFMQGIFARLQSWFADVGNGIAKFFAAEVQTERLCVGEVCVTEEQFLAMVEAAGDPGTTSSQSSDGYGAGEPDDDPEPEPAATSTDGVVEPEPESSAEAEEQDILDIVSPDISAAEEEGKSSDIEEVEEPILEEAEPEAETPAEPAPEPEPTPELTPAPEPEPEPESESESQSPQEN